MGYIKTLPLPPPRCRSVPHQLPPASAVCNLGSRQADAICRNLGVVRPEDRAIFQSILDDFAIPG